MGERRLSSGLDRAYITLLICHGLHWMLRASNSVPLVPDLFFSYVPLGVHRDLDRKSYVVMFALGSMYTCRARL